MIAHRIKKISATNKFGKLARYVLDAEKGVSLDDFHTLATYVADLKGGSSGERAVGARITNVPTDSLVEAIIYIEATQAMNWRSRAEKSYHLVISFAEGERPTLEQLIDIEDTLCAAIGYADHERISAIHDDTDNLHLHVAINKIHPTSHRNYEMKGDFRRLMVACVELEEKHDLIRDNHGHSDKARLPNGVTKMEAYAMRESLQTWVTTYIPELEAVAASATSWTELQKGLAEYDLEVRARGAGLVISKIGEAISLRASTVSPHFAFKALTDRFGPLEKRADKAQQITEEQIAEREAFRDWLAGQGPVLEPLINSATDWPSLQDQLSGLGLEVRTDGSQFALGRIGGALSVPALELSTQFGFEALTNRLGQFQPSAFQATAQTKTEQGGPKVSYQRKPRQKGEETKALYERFQLVSNQAKADRQSALDQNKADWDKYDLDLKANHKLRYEVIRTNKYYNDPSGKKRAIEQLKRDRLKDWANRRAESARQRKAILAHYAVPAWQPWLQEQAQKGEEAAVTALRSAALYRNKLGADVLSAANVEAARNVVLNETHFKGREAPSIKVQPKAARNGDLVYRLKDGGQITDTAGEIRCDAVSVHAAYMALAIAIEKFPGQPLEMFGSEEFKQSVIMVSSLPGWNLTFSDPQMERDRKSAVEARAIYRQEQGALQYIAGRNAAKDSGIDVKPHRLWDAKDAGAGYFAGRRKFSDGAEAVLIEKNGEVLVKVASSAQMAKASTWSVGFYIETDRQGRFVTEAKQDRERGGR
jgi:hypothetical protein